MRKISLIKNRAVQLTVVGPGILHNVKYAYPEEIKDLTLLFLTQSHTKKKTFKKK